MGGREKDKNSYMAAVVMFYRTWPVGFQQITGQPDNWSRSKVILVLVLPNVLKSVRPKRIKIFAYSKNSESCISLRHVISKNKHKNDDRLTLKQGLS